MKKNQVKQWSMLILSGILVISAGFGSGYYISKFTDMRAQKTSAEASSKIGDDSTTEIPEEIPASENSGETAKPVEQQSTSETNNNQTPAAKPSTSTSTSKPAAKPQTQTKPKAPVTKPSTSTGTKPGSTTTKPTTPTTSKPEVKEPSTQLPTTPTPETPKPTTPKEPAPGTTTPGSKEPEKPSAPSTEGTVKTN